MNFSLSLGTAEVLPSVVASTATHRNLAKHKYTRLHSADLHSHFADRTAGPYFSIADVSLVQ